MDISIRYARVVRCQKGRAHQLNAGAEKARGDILFFVHADMFIPEGGFSMIERKIRDEGFDGGGFSNRFSMDDSRIKRLCRLLNMRVFDNDRPGNTVFFGDNGIFVRKAVFDELGGFKPMPIMEDYDFSVRMKERYRVVRIMNPQLIVSSRRHEKNGYLMTCLQWFFIRRLFLMGVSPDRMARWYYKDFFE